MDEWALKAFVEKRNHSAYLQMDAFKRSASRDRENRAKRVAVRGSRGALGSMGREIEGAEMGHRDFKPKKYLKADGPT